MIVDALPDTDPIAQLYYRNWTGAYESALLSADDVDTLVGLLEQCYPRDCRPGDIRQLIATLSRATEHEERPNLDVVYLPLGADSADCLILTQPPEGVPMLDWLMDMGPRLRGLQLRGRRMAAHRSQAYVGRLVGTSARSISNKEFGRGTFNRMQTERYLAALETGG